MWNSLEGTALELDEQPAPALAQTITRAALASVRGSGRGATGQRPAYVYNAAFEQPAVAAEFLGPAPASDAPARRARSADWVRALFPSALCDVPPLSPAQELHLFRKMNYLKFLAERAERRDADRGAEAARLRAEANEVMNQITLANLRLVVSIVRRIARDPDETVELMSDACVTLIRSVERFDYGRGFKFSTYATNAIVRELDRRVFEDRRHRGRFVTGHDEMLGGLAEWASAQTVHESARRDDAANVARMLRCVSEREQRILRDRFGLNGGSTKSLGELSAEHGVTRERIRQIESEAIAKLRRFARRQRIDFGLQEK